MTSRERSAPHDPQGAPDDGDPSGSSLHAEQIERLFREHNEALIRFLLLRLRSYQAAREVAQEAYVRLLSLHKPGAVSYLRAFLFRTAANLAIDRRRRDDIHSQALELPLFHDFADVRTPERCVAGVQQIDRLQRYLAELPPKCQQAFIMNRFYGADFRVIGRELGVSERSARVYVERALLHCKERQDEESGHG